MALSNALDPQNPMPSCMIFAGERRLAIGPSLFLQKIETGYAPPGWLSTGRDDRDKSEEESERPWLPNETITGRSTPPGRMMV